MSIIKKYKWFILSVIILLFIIGKLFSDNSRAKRIIEKSNKKIHGVQTEINKLKKDRSEILIEKSEIEKRYEEIKNDPPIKIIKVPEIKYRTIEKIKYIESNKYEEAWSAWKDCDKKFKLSISIFDDLGINYNNYIFKADRIEKKTEEKSDIFEEARNDLGKISMKNWSLVFGPSISISTDGIFRFSLSLTYGKKII